MLDWMTSCTVYFHDSTTCSFISFFPTATKIVSGFRLLYLLLTMQSLLQCGDQTQFSLFMILSTFRDLPVPTWFILLHTRMWRIQHCSMKQHHFKQCLWLQRSSAIFFCWNECRKFSTLCYLSLWHLSGILLQKSVITSYFRKSSTKQEAIAKGTVKKKNHLVGILNTHCVVKDAASQTRLWTEVEPKTLFPCCIALWLCNFNVSSYVGKSQTREHSL